MNISHQPNRIRDIALMIENAIADAQAIDKEMAKGDYSKAHVSTGYVMEKVSSIESKLAVVKRNCRNAEKGIGDLYS